MPHCYTLEANYARGKNINHLRPRFDLTKEQVIREDCEVANSFSRIYGDMYELIELRDKIISNSNESMMTTELEE